MDKTRLQNLLTDLHRELSSAGSIDPESRRLLDQNGGVAGAVQPVCERRARDTGPADGDPHLRYAGLGGKAAAFAIASR